MKAQGLNPRIRKSPNFKSSLKYGVTEFHPYNSMWMPVGYDTPINEQRNTVEARVCGMSRLASAGIWS
jgi:hypothetical protein